MKNTFFGLVALVPPFRGFFDGSKVCGALPGSGGRCGSYPCSRSSTPVFIGPVDGHLGVCARFRSFAQWGGGFLSNGGGGRLPKGVA
jgi:hypothetical protein